MKDLFYFKKYYLFSEKNHAVKSYLCRNTLKISLNIQAFEGNMAKEANHLCLFM